MTKIRDRRGYATLLVLWLLVIASSVGLSAVLTGRDEYHFARNRFEAERAQWRAHGCASEAEASVDEILEAASSNGERTRRWRHLDTLITVPNAERWRCVVVVRAAGSRLNINEATEEQLARALAQIADTRGSAALIDAILDWRGARDDARNGMVDTARYRGAHGHEPRKGPFASTAELHRVRGLDSIQRLDALFDVESGRVSLPNASGEVLLSLPGLACETVDRLLELRADGHDVEDLMSLTGRISATAAESLMTRYAELSLATTLEPDAWIATVTASSGRPEISVVIELRLIRRGNSSAVVRRRTWS